MTHLRYPRLKCPTCGSKESRYYRLWEPEKGYDPLMKKYKCLDCHVDYYIALQLTERVC